MIKNDYQTLLSIAVISLFYVVIVGGGFVFEHDGFPAATYDSSSIVADMGDGDLVEDIFAHQRVSIGIPLKIYRPTGFQSTDISGSINRQILHETGPPAV